MSSILTREVCSYSGHKILPGHGSREVRSDCKVLNFETNKCKVHYENKWNPLKIDWTFAARRAHNKETISQQKKRKQRTVRKVVRGFTASVKQE